MAERVISYSFVGRFNNLTAGLTAAGRSVDNFNTRLTATDRNGERMRRGLSTIGDAAGKMGLAAAAGLGVIVAATARFEKSMSAVQAATGASAAELEKLRAAAIKAGADTIFSASEAADGITELGKAGLSTADILSGGLTGALNLAAAGQISVADAASTTAITLQQFKLSGDQASRVADTLAASAGKALGSVSDMSEALKYVGPVAAQMGLSLEDTIGVIAELASQGILGSQAGTSLRGMLTSLTSPSKLASQTMTGLGISMYDAQGKFVGLEGIAGQLHDTMGNLTNAERDQALGRIFGNEQITAARILYAGGADDVRKWTAQVTDSGYAADQAAKLTDNLSGDLEQFKGSLETALIGAGEGSQGPLRGLVQKATEAVNVFNALPGPIKSTTTGLLGIVAITGGAAFFGAKVVSGIAATNAALAALGVTARVTAGSLATVGASVGALAVVTVGYGSDALSMQDSWNRSRAASDAYGNSIDEVTKNLEKSNLGKYASDLGIDINRLATDLVQNGKSGVYASEVMDQLKDSSTGAGNVLKDYASNVLPFYTSGASKAFDASLDLNNVIDGMSKQGVTASAALGLVGVKLTDGQAAALDAAAATDAYGDASTSAAAAATAAAESAYQTAEQVQDTAKALEEAHKAAEQTAQGFFNLGDSLNDSKVSLNDWITNLQKQAEALANFQHNLKEVGEKGLRKGLIDALREAGPEGAMRLAQLADASETQIGRANKAWKRGQGLIENYVSATAKVPPIVTTEVQANAAPAKSVLTDVKGKVTDLGKMVARVLVEANTNPAKSAIAGVRAELASLKDKTIYVNVRRPNAGGMGPQLRARGGAIYGPGTSTSDSIPAALSNGEYVVKTKAVNRYGVAMMDAINQERFATGGLVGFADGGKSDDKGAAKARARSRVRSRAGKALSGLDVDLAVNAEGASDALSKFSDDLEKVRGLFKDAHLKWSDALQKQTKALTAAARQFDGLNATLSQARQDQAAFASSVGSSVSSATLTGGGLDGLNAGLAANTNDTNAAASALSTAVANGLNGALFDFLAQSGDTNLLGQFGTLSADQIQQEENAYNAMLAAQASFGGTAGYVKYGSQIASLEKTQKDLKDAINQMVNKLPDKVYAGARDGSHDGSKSGTSQADANKNTQTTQNTQAFARGGGHRRGKGRS